MTTAPAAVPRWSGAVRPPTCADSAPTPVPRRTLLRSGAVLAVGVVRPRRRRAPTTRPRAGRSPPRPRDRTRCSPAPTAAPARSTRPACRDPAALAAATVAATRALVERSTAVVVTSAATDDLVEATRTARRLGIPLLVSGDPANPEQAAELEAELGRLQVRTVVRVVASPSAPAPSPSVPERFGSREVLDASATGSALPGLPHRPARRGATVLLQRGATLPPVLEATLSAVGAETVTRARRRPAGERRGARRPQGARRGRRPGRRGRLR